MRPVSFNQDVKALVPNSSLLPAYLTYALHARRKQILDLVSSAGSGTGVLDTNLLQRLPIWLPSLSDQQAIVKVVDDAETVTSFLKRQITKKQAFRKGLMQRLLTGRTRLPGYHETWPVNPLQSAIGRLESGISVKSVTSPGPYGVLKTSCVSDGSFDPSERKTVAPRDIARAKLSPQANSIIISRMNTIALVGEAGYVDKDYPELFLPDRLWLASENHANLADMRWLAYILSSEQYRDQLRDLATGTSGSMKNISRSTFLNISVHFPKLEEQRAIVNVLAEADLEIDAYHTRLEKSKAVKQGMMQQLLTGRTRLLV